MDATTELFKDIWEYLDGLVAKGRSLRGSRLVNVRRDVMERFAVSRQVAQEEIRLWCAERDERNRGMETENRGHRAH